MKHAFLINAHNNFNVLKVLLSQLSHKDFDIYIHVDAKTKTLPKEMLLASVKNASINFIERMNVAWGEYSNVKSIIALMTAASKSYHDYYHVISGADLMLVTPDEFIKFFENNRGFEFVGFSKTFNEDLYRYRHYFRAKARSKSPSVGLMFARIHKLLIIIQKVFGLAVDVKYDVVKKGADWYSVTHEAVKFIIQEEPTFRKYFYRASTPTEFLPHTILYNSDFRDRIYQPQPYTEGAACLRYIDWDRGQPYTFTINEKEELLSVKGYIFARKFDENIDMDIVKAVSNAVSLKRIAGNPEEML